MPQCEIREMKYGEEVMVCPIERTNGFKEHESSL